MNRTDTCWIWTSTKKPGGYGRFDWSLKHKPLFNTCRAHRIAYQLIVGPVADGVHLHHVCENPSCVNPAHLIPLSPKEHGAAHAGQGTHCKYGHALTPDNCLYDSDGTHRRCRTCRNEQQIAGRLRRFKPKDAAITLYNRQQGQLRAIASRKCPACGRGAALSKAHRKFGPNYTGKFCRWCSYTTVQSIAQ